MQDRFHTNEPHLGPAEQGPDARRQEDGGRSTAAFVLACTEGIDWPPGPTLVLSVLGVSMLLAGATALVRRLRA